MVIHHHQRRANPGPKVWERLDEMAGSSMGQGMASIERLLTEPLLLPTELRTPIALLSESNPLPRCRLCDSSGRCRTTQTWRLSSRSPTTWCPPGYTPLTSTIMLRVQPLAASFASKARVMYVWSGVWQLVPKRTWTNARRVEERDQERALLDRCACRYHDLCDHGVHHLCKCTTRDA